MAKPKKYFIRTVDGHKGPHSFVQMKASIQALTLSPSAEYRTSEDEEWRPKRRPQGREDPQEHQNVPEALTPRGA